MINFIKVANKADIPQGGVRVVKVNDVDIAIFNVSDQYYALNDTCPHMGGSMSKGTIEGNVLICSWHQAKFDIVTGIPTGDKNLKRLTCYQVQIEGEEIKLAVA